MSDDLQRLLNRRRRQMILWVALTAIVGLGSVAALLIGSKARSLYREHYDFRREVRVGTAEEEILAKFGPPYRTFGSRRELEAALSGRGHYKTFDAKLPPGLRWATEEPKAPAPGQPPAAQLPPVMKVLHYRPTLDHGEFVLIGEDGKVVMVVTGRP